MLIREIEQFMNLRFTQIGPNEQNLMVVHGQNRSQVNGIKRLPFARVAGVDGDYLFGPDR